MSSEHFEHKNMQGKIYNIGFGRILSLSIPTLIAHFAVLFIGLVDLYFVGKLGPAAITATSIGVLVWWTIAYFFDGLRSAMVVLVANSHGKNDLLTISRLLNVGLLIAMLAGIAFLLGSNYLATRICGYLSTDPTVLCLGIEFLTFLLPATAFCFVMYVIEGFFRGIGNVKIPMIIAIVVSASSAFFDYVFIDGHFGFMPMGVKGAAIATAGAHVLGGLVGLLFLFFHNDAHGFFLPDAGVGSQLVKYAKVAFDTGIYSGLVQLAMIVFTGMLQRSGTVAQAANQIANEVFNISFLPPLAFMVTVSMMVSNLLGRGLLSDIRIVIFRVLVLSIGLVSIMSVFSFYFAMELATFFSPVNIDVAKLAARAIQIAAINQVFCSITMVLRGALIGLGRTIFVRYIGIGATIFFFLPVAYFFVSWLDCGLLGGYVALTLWTIFVLIFFAPATWKACRF